VDCCLDSVAVIGPGINNFTPFVGDHLIGFESLTQGFHSLIYKCFAQDLLLHVSPNLGVVAGLVTHHTGRVSAGAVVGTQSGFRGTTRFNVGIGKSLLFGGEVKACCLCECHYLIIQDGFIQIGRGG